MKIDTEMERVFLRFLASQFLYLNDVSFELLLY